MESLKTIFMKSIFAFIFSSNTSRKDTRLWNTVTVCKVSLFYLFCEQFFYNMLNNLKTLKFFLVKKWFLTKCFYARARPRPTLLVLSLETFKVVTRLAGPSSQVSPTERQVQSLHHFIKRQQSQKLLPTCPSSNLHTSKEPSSSSHRKLK